MVHCTCDEGERKTVYDYFQRACCRVHEARSGQAGKLVKAEDGASAQFFLEGGADNIVEVTYRCASCVTLIALCEHLAELARLGSEDVTSERLLQLHPEIPPSKQSRASLAVRAFQSAIQELKT